MQHNAARRSPDYAPVHTMRTADERLHHTHLLVLLQADGAAAVRVTQPEQALDLQQACGHALQQQRVAQRCHLDGGKALARQARCCGYGRQEGVHVLVTLHLAGVVVRARHHACRGAGGGGGLA